MVTTSIWSDSIPGCGWSGCPLINYRCNSVLIKVLNEFKKKKTVLFFYLRYGASHRKRVTKKVGTSFYSKITRYNSLSTMVKQKKKWHERHDYDKRNWCPLYPLYQVLFFNWTFFNWTRFSWIVQDCPGLLGIVRDCSGLFRIVHFHTIKHYFLLE